MGTPPRIVADDTPDEESIGNRDLTSWPTPLGRGLVRLVSDLAAKVSANSVLYITAAAGLALVLGLTAACAEIYDAVAEHDGISGLDQPALEESIALRTDTNTKLITWDEDDRSTDNRVAMVVLHPALKGRNLKGRKVTTRLDHYALSATISRLGGARPLRNADGAPDLLAAFRLS